VPSDLRAHDIDAPAGDVTAATETVEMLADLVTDSARAAVVAARLEALEAKVAAAVVRSRAPATLCAYRSDWRDFAVFCGQLGVDAPGGSAVVAGYVAELADPPDDRPAARVSTITRRLAAIGEGHKGARRVDIASISAPPGPSSRTLTQPQHHRRTTRRPTTRTHVGAPAAPSASLISSERSTLSRD